MTTANKGRIFSFHRMSFIYRFDCSSKIELLKYCVFFAISDKYIPTTSSVLHVSEYYTSIVKCK